MSKHDPTIDERPRFRNENLGRTTVDGNHSHDFDYDEDEEITQNSARPLMSDVNGAVLTDLNGVVQFVNRPWAEIHGYRQEDLFGLKLSFFFPPRRTDFLRFFETLMKQGQNQEEIFHLHCDQSDFLALTSGYVIRDESNSPSGFLYLCSLQKQEKIENPPRSKPREFIKDINQFSESSRAVLNSMHDGVVVVEMIMNEDGKPIDGRIIDSNSSFDQLTERSRELVIGKMIREVLPDTESAWFDICTNVIVTGDPVRIESYSTIFERYLETSVFPLNKNCVTCVFRDVSDRPSDPGGVGAEIELRSLIRNMILQMENERLTLGKIVEENLIRGITGTGRNLEILQNYIDGGDHEGIDKTFQMIRREFGILTETTQALLRRFKPDVFEKSTILDGLTWYAQRFSQSTSLIVFVEGEAPRPQLSHEKEYVLFKIVEESLNNIAQHSDTTRATITVTNGPGVVNLNVADEGKGFKSSQMLSQGLESCRGMLTMREHALALGGTFSVESSPQEGTRIIVTIPNE